MKFEQPPIFSQEKEPEKKPEAKSEARPEIKKEITLDDVMDYFYNLSYKQLKFAEQAHKEGRVEDVKGLDEASDRIKNLGNQVQNKDYENPLRFLEEKVGNKGERVKSIEENIYKGYGRGEETLKELEEAKKDLAYHRELAGCLGKEILEREKPYDKQGAMENFINYVKKQKEITKDEKDKKTLGWLSDLDGMVEEVRKGRYQNALSEMERIAGIYAELLSESKGMKEEHVRGNIRDLKRARKLIQFFSKEMGSVPEPEEIPTKK